MSAVNASTKQQQYAQLQSMGVTIYTPLASITLASQPWLKDVCSLLNIEISDCIFDAIEPTFDVKRNKLHLPATSHANEQSLKKLIWQHIRPFVN